MANTNKTTKPRKKANAKDAANAVEVEFVDVPDGNNEQVAENTSAVTPEVVTAEDAVNALNVAPDDTSEELPPLTSQALQYFTPEAQKNILALADAIDVTLSDKVMQYGKAPIIKSFEQSGRVLQDAEGTTADQKVVEEVLAIAKQASDARDDFNLTIKEPGFFTKMFYKLSANAKDKHAKEVAVKAVTNFKILEQLNKSSDRWTKALQEGHAQIKLSAEQDNALCSELEQYIVAGRIAEERIAGEVAVAKDKYELSGLSGDKQAYKELEDGLDTFRITLLALEKARGAAYISSAQLELTEKANKNIQIAVRTQQDVSMGVAAQQLRNAVLDFQNRVIMEGQKSLTALNDGLLKKISSNTVLTAEESEKLLLTGVYTVDAALEAAQTVIDGCAAIEKARVERPTMIKSELDRLNTLMSELSPVVDNMMKLEDKKTSTTSKPTSSSGGLTF